MTPNDLNILKWYTRLGDQHRYSDLGQGRNYKLLSSIYRFPPFDFIKEKNGGSITYLSLVSLEDGSIVNILDKLVATGLEGHQTTNFDAYRYPSATNINMGIIPGQYYAVMRDNAGGEWFSEVITFCQSTTDKVVLEWFHLERFVYSEGWIEYAFPYRGRMVFPTKPGKPTYQIEKDVQRRDGKNFTRQTVSYKEYRFWFLAPEYVLDALSKVDQHDCKEIHYNGQTYTVDEITFTPEWSEQRDVAWVECVFITDTVVVINGRAVGDKTYVADDGTCLSVRYTARGEMTESDPDYINRTFQGSPMNDGDIFVIVDGALDKRVKVYNQGADTFDDPLIATKDVVYVEDSGTYYFHEGTLKVPEITAVLDTPDRVQGITFSGVQMEVWTKDDFGDEYLAGVGTASEFEGAGIEFSPRSTDTFVKVRVSSTRCNQFSESGWTPFTPDGIGYMIIEGGPPTNQVG
jgi:hypothetical protein